MRWVFLSIIALLFTRHWLAAGMLVGLAYWLSRPQSKPLREHPTPQPFPQPSPPTSLSASSHQHLLDLSILRFELEHWLAEGTIDRARYEQIIEGVNLLSHEILAHLVGSPVSTPWTHSRDAAWAWLSQRNLVSADAPPWRTNAQPRTEETRASAMDRAGTALWSALATEATADSPHVVSPASAQPSSSRSIPPLSAESADFLKQSPLVPSTIPTPLREAAQAQAFAHTVDSAAQSASLPPPSGPVSHPTQPEDSVWQPATPSALERALQAVSGWPAFLIPFLAQNILQILGAFCGIAASIILVSTSTGPFKALAVVLVIFGYTIAPLWLGYVMRRRRPELRGSSTMLLTLGVLLAPLSIASAVRLTQTAETPGWYVTGLAAAIVSIVVLYVATTVVSGIMDRSLQGRHPQVFLALAALQLAAPLVSYFPSWIFLAGIHLLLLSVLAYGLVLFTQDWLHSLFVEQRKIAYYAAGTLVYAAAVSFVHLTVGHQQPIVLPRGYYSPFLMTLCGLLFYVDAQLKQWAHQYTFLSRISFVLYALSVVALLLSLDAPGARVMTLLVGIGVYGAVMRQYLTLPPLYLLLLCLAWLYQLAVLQHLPAQWHLLASLPGVTGMFATSRWLQQRHSTQFALACYRLWLGTTVLLTAWSLLHSQPSVTAMSTGIAALAVVFHGLRFAPAGILSHAVGVNASTDLRHSPWLYLVTLIGSITVVYAPRLTSFTWATQCAFALTFLALLWSALGLRLRQIDRGSKAATVEVLLNSALLNLALVICLATILGVLDVIPHSLLPLLLICAAGVTLWLSLALTVQWLFYCVLALAGAAGAIFKLTYFPQPSSGTVEAGLALAAWVFLWRLESAPAEVTALRRAQRQLQADLQPLLTLLWRLPVTSAQLPQDIVRIPLQQAMALLWIVGVIRLASSLWEFPVDWRWTLSATLAAVGAALGSGFFQTLALLPLAVLLGLSAWLTLLFNLGIHSVAQLALAGALYALCVWQGATIALIHPAVVRVAKFLWLRGDRALVEQYIHWTVISVSLLCVTIPLEHSGLFIPNVPLLLTFMVTTSLFWLAGWKRRLHSHSYTVLVLGALSVTLSYIWIFHVPPSTPFSQWEKLLHDPRLGFFWALLSLSYVAIARQLARRRPADEVTDLAFARSLYRKPLHVVAALVALSALALQVSVGVQAWTGFTTLRSGEAFLPLTWLVLTFVVFPLAQPLRHAAAIRGIATPLLLSAFLASSLHLCGLEPWKYAVAALWSFTLWHAGNFGLPRFNRRWSQWSAAPVSWPWFGVVGVALSLVGSSIAGVQGLSSSAVHHAGYLFAVAGYCLLMLRNSAWVGFSWVAVFALTWAGQALLVGFLWPSSPTWAFALPVTVPAPLGFVLGKVGWVNLLLLGVPLWRVHGQKIATGLGWYSHNLEPPFLVWPSLLLGFWLIDLASWNALVLLSSLVASIVPALVTQFTPWPLVVVIGAVLTGSFLHAWWWRRASNYTQAVLSAAFCTLLTTWIGVNTPLFHLSLFLALWSALLLLVHSAWTRMQWGTDTTLVIRQTLHTWLEPSLVVAMLTWVVHGGFLVFELAGFGQPQRISVVGDPVVTLISATLLLALGIRQARHTQRPEWVYAVAVFGVAVGAYIRLLFVGLASLTAWDTTAIMAVTYVLFVLQRLTQSKPLFHVVMVLPWLTLLTVPLQLASPHTTSACVTAGMLYLLTYRNTEQRLPLYLALLAFNAALYVWTPNWADRYHIIQLYVTPAALSVLLLLHLHRHELKPSLANRIRFATMSVLYASITADVFLREGLLLFCIMLALSLAGIFIGLALRTRVFLYTGVATLVLNVVGQVILRFPEQGFAQALVLLATATIFIGLALWLERQREEILQRIRIFRADLATWA